MTVRSLINKLIESDPDLEVFIYVPAAGDDFAVSEVTEQIDADRTDYVRLNFAA